MKPYVIFSAIADAFASHVVECASHAACSYYNQVFHPVVFSISSLLLSCCPICRAGRFYSTCKGNTFFPIMQIFLQNNVTMLQFSAYFLWKSRCDIFQIESRTGEWKTGCGHGHITVRGKSGRCILSLPSFCRLFAVFLPSFCRLFAVIECREAASLFCCGSREGVFPRDSHVAWPAKVGSCSFVINIDDRPLGQESERVCPPMQIK